MHTNSMTTRNIMPTRNWKEGMRSARSDVTSQIGVLLTTLANTRFSRKMPKNPHTERTVRISPIMKEMAKTLNETALSRWYDFPS